MLRDPMIEQRLRIRESMRAENGHHLAVLARAAKAQAIMPTSGAPMMPSEPEKRTTLTQRST